MEHQYHSRQNDDNKMLPDALSRDGKLERKKRNGKESPYPFYYNVERIRTADGRRKGAKKGSLNKSPGNHASAKNACNESGLEILSKNFPNSKQFKKQTNERTRGAETGFGLRPLTNQTLTRDSSSMAALDYNIRIANDKVIPGSLISCQDLQKANQGETFVWPIPKTLGSIATPLDVQIVERWVDNVTREIEMEQEHDLEDKLTDLEHVYFMAFFELARQVMANNFHRGELMVSYWKWQTELVNMRQQASQYKQATTTAQCEKLQRTVTEQQVQISRLRKEIEDAQNNKDTQSLKTNKGGKNKKIKGLEEAPSSPSHRNSRLTRSHRATLNSARKSSVMRKSGLQDSVFNNDFNQGKTLGFASTGSPSSSTRALSRNRKSSIFDSSTLHRLSRSLETVGDNGDHRDNFRTSASNRNLALPSSNQQSQAQSPKGRQSMVAVFDKYFQNMEKEIDLNHSKYEETYAKFYQADENELRVSLLEDDLAVALEQIQELESTLKRQNSELEGLRAKARSKNHQEKGIQVNIDDNSHPHSNTPLRRLSYVRTANFSRTRSGKLNVSCGGSARNLISTPGHHQRVSLVLRGSLNSKTNKARKKKGMNQKNESDNNDDDNNDNDNDNNNDDDDYNNNDDDDYNNNDDDDNGNEDDRGTTKKQTIQSSDSFRAGEHEYKSYDDEVEIEDDGSDDESISHDDRILDPNLERKESKNQEEEEEEGDRQVGNEEMANSTSQGLNTPKADKSNEASTQDAGQTQAFPSPSDKEISKVPKSKKSTSIQTLKWTLKSIWCIIQDRIFAGKKTKQLVKPFVYDFYKRKYGTQVAKRHIKTLTLNIFHYQTHPGVSLFFKFYSGELNEKVFNFYLKAISLCRTANSNNPADAQKSHKKAHEKATSKNVLFPEDEEGNPNWVALDRVNDLVTQLYPSLPDASVENIKSVCFQVSTTGPCTFWRNDDGQHVRSLLEKTPRVDRSVFLYSLIHEILDVERTTRQLLTDVFIDWMSEDALLFRKDFISLLVSLDLGISTQDALALFSEALLHSNNAHVQEEAVCCEAFVAVCGESGITYA